MNSTVKSVAKWVVSQRVARMIGGKRMWQISILMGLFNAVRHMRNRPRTA